jgi:uroporphyrinogen decarboxylase
MRQAGRHLPEYNKVRVEVNNFLDLCYNPELAAEVTLQPIRRYGLDAAIIFSDILVIPDALGMEVKFIEKEGPVLAEINDNKDIKKLKLDNFEQHLTPVYEAIDLVKNNLPAEVALIGFAGSPWTIATYMIEGHGSKTFQKSKCFAYTKSNLFAQLIEILVEAISRHLIAQIKAGAEIVQLFDSWAGVHTEEQFVQWVINPTKKIIAKVKAIYPNIPIIGFPKGAGLFYKDYAAQTNVDCLGLDSSISASFVKENIKTVIQGNLDPVFLLGSKDQVINETKRILDQYASKQLIFNLGHGVLKETPIENVHALISTVRNYQKI